MQNNETTVNVNLTQTEMDYTSLTIYDRESEEELTDRIIPTEMTAPAVGDIISLADLRMSGSFENMDGEAEVVSASDRYEVVHRRLDYHFHDYDFDDKDLEEGVSLHANIWVVEKPLEEDDDWNRE
ncbi:hypothetical protein Htur_5048 (plasmid) [Haloterrigena turkmenica DSM 5511]|uniref:Uncharacterized protein n=1 Tax=Haloterrigena turkmenica (strain ATCC 51198 / DSM 5511 / JCM 9101 / NCIMB 13204 / VKM B-1734 / 4k) TaxID=543526 RepID=D2S3I8_HALTV|nr:hypothetical protein [Haloterrigena turkmenica]ADB63935.1 hypothetical protein Htur_5048 [Haloterrigena turkmenica DSM 5511]